MTNTIGKISTALDYLPKSSSFEWLSKTDKLEIQTKINLLKLQLDLGWVLLKWWENKVQWSQKLWKSKITIDTEVAIIHNKNSSPKSMKRALDNITLLLRNAHKSELKNDSKYNLGNHPEMVVKLLKEIAPWYQSNFIESEVTKIQTWPKWVSSGIEKARKLALKNLSPLVIKILWWKKNPKWENLLIWYNHNYIRAEKLKNWAIAKHKKKVKWQKEARSVIKRINNLKDTNIWWDITINSWEELVWLVTEAPLTEDQRSQSLESIAKMREQFEIFNDTISLKQVKKVLDNWLEDLKRTKPNDNWEIHIILNTQGITDKAQKILTWIIGWEETIQSQIWEIPLKFQTKFHNGKEISALEDWISSFESIISFMNNIEWKWSWSLARDAVAYWTLSFMWYAGEGIQNNWDSVLWNPYTTMIMSLPWDAFKVLAIDSIKRDVGENIWIWATAWVVAYVSWIYIANWINRADSGMRPWSMEEILDAIELLRQSSVDLWDDATIKLIDWFKAEHNSIFMESTSDKFVWLQDPFLAKKAFYRLLDQHFTWYQWLWHSIPWWIGQKLDTPVLPRIWDWIERQWYNRKKYAPLFNPMTYVKAAWEWYAFFHWKWPTKFFNKSADWWWVMFKDTANSSYWIRARSIADKRWMVHRFIKGKLEWDRKKAFLERYKKIHKSRAPFSKSHPFLKKKFLWKTTNQATAELLKEFWVVENSTHVSDIKKQFDNVDEQYDRIISALKENIEEIFPFYNNFIQWHPSLSDEVERQLLKELNWIINTSSSSEMLDTRMAKLLWKIPDIWELSLEQIKNILDKRWNPIPVTTDYKMEIQRLLNERWVDGDTIQKIMMFLGEGEWKKMKVMLKKHITYGIVSILKDKNIQADDVVSPVVLDNFFSSNAYSGVINEDPLSYLKSRSMNLDKVDVSKIEFHKAIPVNTITWYSSSTDIPSSSEDVALYVQRKKGIKWVASKWREMLPANLWWKHSFYRNSYTDNITELRPQEVALDNVLRMRLVSELVHDYDWNTDWDKTIKDIVNWKQETINTFKDIDVIIMRAAATWDVLFSRIEGLPHDKINTILKNMWVKYSWKGIAKTWAQIKWAILWDKTNILIKALYTWLK